MFVGIILLHNSPSSPSRVLYSRGVEPALAGLNPFIIKAESSNHLVHNGAVIIANSNQEITLEPRMKKQIDVLDGIVRRMDTIVHRPLL